MKSGFVTVRTGMAEPEPPQPLPFPVRIIRDPRPPSSPEMLKMPPPERSSSKTDYFYQTWDRFLSVQPKRAKRVSRAAQKLAKEKAEVSSDSPAEGLQFEENASTSWEQAAAECRAKVAAIVDECQRLNQKYRDAIFNPEATQYCFNNLMGEIPAAVEDVDAPPWVKRVEDIFDKPQFFIDGATPSDVHQGSGGDCWFLAALMAISAKKELIEDVCVARDEKVGVYGFVFYRDGEWVYEVIDDKLYMRVGDEDDLAIIRGWSRDKREGTALAHNEEKLKNTLQRGGEALYFSHCKSDETWLPLIEKAYAKAHGDYCAIEGGSASEAIEDLTGGVAVVLNPEDIMDKDRFWKEQLSQVNEKYLFGGGTPTSYYKGFVGNHAYTVLRVYEDGDLKLLKLRNPWGHTEWEGDWSDGSKMWTPELMTKLGHTFGDDGVFWISYKDFLKRFHHINRVRLFNKEWNVAQQWTCVSVPWTVDYLDTKFEITITERGPLVVVLSQPDTRYFEGLQGRYMYALHFRMYKEGSTTYLIRSMHNSGNGATSTRSVSAELDDVEPGTYSVIFKITAMRTTDMTAAESINKYAIDRKEKLLAVGRRFDYAQTKGNLRSMEKARQKQMRNDARAQSNNAAKSQRRLNMKIRTKEKMKRQRIADAMKEKKRKADDERQERRRQRRADRELKKSDDQPPQENGKDVYVKEVAEEVKDSPESSAVVAIEVKVQESKTDENSKDGGSPKPNESQASDIPAKKEDEATQESDDGDDSPVAEAPHTPKSPKSVGDVPEPPIETLTNDMNSMALETDYFADPPADPDPFARPFSPKPKTPSSPLSSFVDDDFPWDSDIDGLTYPSTTSSSISDTEEYDLPSPPRSRKSRAKSSPMSTTKRGNHLDFLNGDPWNALLVLGLRVYSKGEVRVKVVKDDDDDSEEEEEEEEEEDNEERE